MNEVGEKRAKALERFVENILYWILRVEKLENFWVRRVKVYLSGETYKCRVDIINDMGDDFSENLERFEGRIAYAVANLKSRWGFEKIFVEVDFTKGAVSVRVQDWGVIICPLVLRDHVAKLVHGSDSVMDPNEGGWSNRQLKEGDFGKTARQILSDDAIYHDLAVLLLKSL